MLAFMFDLPIKFKIKKKLKNGLGRAGVLETKHGQIKTPTFVPVACNKERICIGVKLAS